MTHTINNNNKKPICLEGNAGCGKTTSGKALTAELNGVFLREYTETMDDRHRLLLMENFNLNSEDSNYHLWEYVEHHRLQLALNSQRIPILDTSLVSVIVFELARIAFGHGGNLTSLVSGYIQLIVSNKILLPSRMILLQTAEAIRQVRLSVRGECHPFLIRQDVSEFLTRLRVEFFEKYLPCGSWATIDTSNLAVYEVNNRVVELSDCLKTYDLQESFTTWLGEVPQKVT